MRVRSAQLTSVDPYLPYWDHPHEGAMLLEDGSLMAMCRLRGVPHELCLTSERNAAGELLNRLYCDIADDNITLGFHLVREEAPAAFYEAQFRNGFSEAFWRAYCDNVLRDQLFTNTWYFSLILSPRLLPIGTRGIQRKLNRYLFQFHKDSARGALVKLSDLELIWSHVCRSLSVYSVERLGWRYQGESQYRFSEIGEAMRRVLGYGGAAPMLSGRISRAIYSDAYQPIFERRIFRILPPGCDDDSDDAPGVRWGQIFCLNDYMERTRPDVVDELLSRPYPLVLSQAYGFYARPDAVARLRLKRKQMKASDDQAVKQRRQMKKATSQVAGGELGWGRHNVSLAIYAPTYHALLRNAADAHSVLTNTGASIVPESDGIMAAYFGQLPGNPDLHTGPGILSTRTLADLANFGAFPGGERHGRWGNGFPIPTTARTVYYYTPHVGEVGMTLVIGPSGSGKTAFTCALLAMMDQYLVDKPGLMIVHDADRSSEIFIEAIGGKYLDPRVGENSGFAPLLGFRRNTPYARDCLHRIFTDCIMRDGRGPIPPEDNARIERGTAAMLDLPPKERSLIRMRQFLGWDNPMGAGPRFEPWCRGDNGRPDGSLAWVFDNDEDRVDFNAPAFGVNFGPLLEMPNVIEPCAEYLRCRMEPLFDGRRIVIVFDEAQAYLPAANFAERMKTFLQRARKLGVVMFILAQQPEDMLRGPLGAAIVGQCHTIIVSPTSKANHDVYCGKQGLRFTEGEFHAITSRMRPREILIHRRGTQDGAQAQSVIVKPDLGPLPPWYLNVLSGRKSTVALKDELQNKMPQWLTEFAERAPLLVE
jgi:type IV secretion system protein VirB4